MVTVKLEHLQQVLVLLPSIAIITFDIEIPNVNAASRVATDQLHIVYSESHCRYTLLVRECALTRAATLNSGTLLLCLVCCSSQLLHPSKWHLVDV